MPSKLFLTAKLVIFTAFLVIFLSVSQDVSALLLAHVEVSNYSNSEVDITWATDASASTEVHYGLTTALGSTATGDAGEIHKVHLSGLQSETTYFFEVVSGGQLDNNGGSFYQFKTTKVGFGSFHTLLGYIKNGQGQAIAGALVMLTVEDSLPLSSLTDASGIWSVDLTNLKNKTSNDVQSFANSDNVSITVYAPDEKAGSGKKGSGTHTLAGVGSSDSEMVADIIADEPDSSLPVELSSFLGKYDFAQKSITLTWRTETEVGNVGFAVYRSESKNGSYTEIAFVDGAMNSAMPNDYQFIDKEVEEGKTYFYYIEDIDIAGLKSKSEIIKVIVPSTKPVEPIPKEFRLLQNYPNPFNPDTWIPFQLAKDADVVVKIYDIGGHLIRVLNIGQKRAGTYIDKQKAVYWDGRNDIGEKVSSGLYFYTLQAGSYSATKRMLILK